MSQHHTAQQWSKHSPKLRAMIAPSLPRACVEGCGRQVTSLDKWHVAHLRGAASGGAPSLANVGPAHARCNTSSGGKQGAAKTNAARRASTIRHGNW